MSEWISVKEKAPDGKCIVYLSEPQQGRFVHSADFTHKAAAVIGERFEWDCSGDVTHWMPIDYLGEQPKN